MRRASHPPPMPDAAPRTFRSGRAFPRHLVWRARVVGALGLLLGLLLFSRTLGRLLVHGESAFTFMGEAVVATPERPWPAFAAGGLSLAFAALLALPSVLLWREARKGAPEWTVSARGLVRRRGGEVRTLPWSSFRRVWVGPFAGARGDVYLWRRRFGLSAFRWFRAEEGRVWTPGRALVLADVEAPDEVAALLRRHVDAAAARDA